MEWEKIKLWEMENFDLILEASNHMTCELRDEGGPPSTEWKTERYVMREERGKTIL